MPRLKIEEVNASNKRRTFGELSSGDVFKFGPGHTYAVCMKTISRTADNTTYHGYVKLDNGFARPDAADRNVHDVFEPRGIAPLTVTW